MKKFVKSLLFVGSLFLVLSCANDGDGSDGSDGRLPYRACYVLNSGDFKSNNSSLTKFCGATGETVQNYFELQNGRVLGNTANDIIIYGSKMYIAVSGEGTIEVTDLNAKSLRQIKCGEQGEQPRYLAAHGDKVYATYYNGYVARIDTATLEVEAQCAVGRNPEQLAVYEGKIYVANSGGMDWNTELGYDKTVSVIDVETFTETAKIGVVLNPAVLVPADNGLFLASYGDYGAVPGTLQFITKDGNADVVEACSNMTEICFSNGVLYGFFSQYDANWNATITYMSYNPSNGAVDSPWIKEDFLPVPYKVCAVGDYVCVTSSDYLNDGDVYLYDTDGMLVAKIAAGLNPVKVVAVE